MQKDLSAHLQGYWEKGLPPPCGRKAILSSQGRIGKAPRSHVSSFPLVVKGTGFSSSTLPSAHYINVLRGPQPHAATAVWVTHLRVIRRGIRLAEGRKDESNFCEGFHCCWCSDLFDNLPQITWVGSESGGPVQPHSAATTGIERALFSPPSSLKDIWERSRRATLRPTVSLFLGYQGAVTSGIQWWWLRWWGSRSIAKDFTVVCRGTGSCC